MDQDPLLEGRRRRRALMAEIETSRDEFQAAWDARAEVLSRRLGLFRLGLHHHQSPAFWVDAFGVKGVPYRYPKRQPAREEGWQPRPITDEWP